MWEARKTKKTPSYVHMETPFWDKKREKQNRRAVLHAWISTDCSVYNDPTRIADKSTVHMEKMRMAAPANPRE